MARFSSFCFPPPCLIGHRFFKVSDEFSSAIMNIELYLDFIIIAYFSKSYRLVL